MAKKITTALSNSVPSPGKEPDEDDYQTKDHLRTIIEAHGIVNDPVKMEKVHKLAGRHQKAVTGIQDLKDRRDALALANPSKGTKIARM